MNDEQLILFFFRVSGSGKRMQKVVSSWHFYRIPHVYELYQIDYVLPPKGSGTTMQVIRLFVLGMGFPLHMNKPY